MLVRECLDTWVLECQGHSVKVGTNCPVTQAYLWLYNWTQLWAAQSNSGSNFFSSLHMSLHPNPCWDAGTDECSHVASDVTPQLVIIVITHFVIIFVRKSFFLLATILSPYQALMLAMCLGGLNPLTSI